MKWAESHGLSISSLVRAAISEYIARRSEIKAAPAPTAVALPKIEVSRKALAALQSAVEVAVTDPDKSIEHALLAHKMGVPLSSLMAALPPAIFDEFNAKRRRSRIQ